MPVFSIADFAVPASSLEYLKVPVTAAVTGFTIDAVDFAFTFPGNAPVFADWVAGSWEIGTPNYARVLLGPGGAKQLSRGFYRVFVRITDAPEIPVMDSGLLEVTP